MKAEKYRLSNRRGFFRSLFVLGALPFVAKYSRNSKAWVAVIPKVIGGVFGKFFPKSVVRKGTLGRAVVTPSARKLIATNLKSNRGKSLFINPKVIRGLNYAMNAATVIWIANELFENEAKAEIVNESNEEITTKLTLGVRDLDTGEVELEHDVGIVKIPPHSTERFDFVFKPLKKPGRKVIFGKTESTSIVITESEPIVVLPKGALCEESYCQSGG